MKIAIKREQNPNLFEILSSVSNLREAKKKHSLPVSGFYKCWKSKLWLKMRTTVIVLLICATQTLAVDLYSQNTRLSLSMTNTSIRNVLNTIENQTDFYFIYEAHHVDVERKVSVSANDETIQQILDGLFVNTDITYKISDRRIALTRTSILNNAQQQRSVSGKVTDPSGMSLPGVTVAIKGTTSGTITGSDGTFNLTNIPANATLVFSFVGMKTTEVPVGSQAEIHVMMEESAIGIEEVVAIGYGTTSTKKLTTSVTRIDSEQMEELPLNTIADAFAGQISGVVAESGTGQPGVLPVIRVRGYGSINAGSEPLYVIDGLMAGATEFSMLNPKSIENVTILKDAAAGAIYGSRAGNGVILVTTKKGKYGEAKFSVNATYGLQEVTNKVDVLDRDDFLTLVKEAYSNDGLTLPDFYNRDASNFADTDWQDEIFRVSPYQNYQLSASGGSDKVQYYLAANILDNEGIILTTYSKTYSANGNFNIELNPKLTAGVTFNAAHTKERVNGSIENGFGHGGGAYGIAGNVIQEALWFAPILPVYLENGDYGQYAQGEYAPYFLKGYANPVANLKETHDNYSKNNVLGRLYAIYEPVKGLSLNASFGGRLYSYFRDYHVSPYLAGNGSPFANFSNPVYNGMRAGQANGTATSWTTEAYLDFKHTFAKDHDVEMVAGYSIQYNGNRATTATADSNNRGTANAANPIPRFDNYFRPNIYGAALVIGGGEFGENTFESLFSRVNYSYKDKYLLMGSLRYDGSSKFAPSNRWGLFPALSGAWRVTEETFMKNLPSVNELKLRVSYGVSGNDQFGNYAWQGKVGYGNLYTYAPASLGGVTEIALIPSSIENQNLKWETNAQTDFGVDLGLFKNRVNLTADYFIRKTSNMLLHRALPLENGIAASLLDNIGDMTNKGIELALNTVNIETKDFSWTTGFNLTKIKNEVGDVFTATGEIRYGLGFPGAGTIRIIEGHPIFEIYSWKAIGNYETQEQLTNFPGSNNPKIGDTIFEDYKKDGMLNDDDMQRVGNILPDFTYGFTTNLRYKNFDLAVFLNGSHGASQVMVGARQAALLRPMENTLQVYFDNRYGHGDELYMAFPSTQVSGPRHSNIDYFVWDASYLRIKNVVLGYNIPGQVCSRMGLEKLRVTLGVQNLHTFTDYPFYNPESNSTRGEAGTAQFGKDLGTYPLARIYTVGLNVNF